MNRRERRALGKSGDVEGLMAEAGRLHGQGRLREAAAAYGRIAALRPEKVDVYYNWGQALAGLGRQKEAAAAFRQALARRPNDPEGWNNLGAALLSQNDLAEAEQALIAALRYRPDYRAALTNLGIVRLALGRNDQAADAFSRLLQSDGGAEESCLALARLLPGEAEDGPRLVELAILLLRGGHRQEALLAAGQAAKRLGPSDPAHFDLGVLFARCGALAEAEAHLRRAFVLDPEDSRGARLQLAALGLEPLPPAASAAQIEKIYAMRAASWDEADLQSYYGAQLVAERLLQLPGGLAGLTLLDAGCGTGLVGAKIAGRAGRLEGVDLSAAMLERAAARNIYDELIEGDLVALMARRPGRYDVIAGAATLIHFADLAPVFAAAAAALRDQGWFVFTLFPNDQESPGREVVPAPVESLALGGCFAHGRNYLRRTAESAGLALVSAEPVEHERHHQRPIMALLVTLKKSG